MLHPRDRGRGRPAAVSEHVQAYLRARSSSSRPGSPAGGWGERARVRLPRPLPDQEPPLLDDLQAAARGPRGHVHEQLLARSRDTPQRAIAAAAPEQRRALLDSTARATSQPLDAYWPRSGARGSEKTAGSPAKSCATNHPPERGHDARPRSDDRCAHGRVRAVPDRPRSRRATAHRADARCCATSTRACCRAGGCAAAAPPGPVPLERGRGGADRGEPAVSAGSGQARTGEIKRTAGGWAIRYRDGQGVRRQRGGFRTKAEAKTVARRGAAQGAARAAVPAGRHAAAARRRVPGPVPGRAVEQGAGSTSTSARRRRGSATSAIGRAERARRSRAGGRRCRRRCAMARTRRCGRRSARR